MGTLHSFTHLLFLGSVLSLASAAAPAFAQDPETEQRRAEARDLAQQGDAAFKVGRCDKAIPLWKEANQKFAAPTILFRIARCQALRGRVVDATATLEQLLALPDEPDAPQAFREAKEQATAELPPMRARIAYLSITVDTRSVAVVPEVRIDDRTLAQAQRDVPVDPGTHVVRVKARDTLWEQTVSLQEGQHQQLRVALGVQSAPPPPRPQRTVGLLIGGLGLASLAAGGFFAVSAANEARELESVCGPDRKQCPPDRQDDIDRLKTNALLADLTVGAGAALFAAGAIVVLTESPPKADEPRIVVLPVGLGAAVRGSF